MAKIPGVPITGQIVPTDTNDTYPTHTDEYGKGGYRSVTNLDARNAIPTQRRKLGMKVYCIDEDQQFILKDVLDDSGWQIDEGGSGGVTDHDLLSNRGINRHDAINLFIASKGQAEGLAPLGADNKIPNQYIPALALMDTQFATSQAEMLALTAQKGDLCIRQDETKTYILLQEPATTLSNWTPLLFPGSVVSVNGKTGIVAIGLADLIDVVIVSPTAKHTICYNTVSGKFENRLLEIADINGLVTALTGKANSVHEHTISQITDYVSDITSRLLTKANTTHSHAIADINDLTNQLNSINTALSGKAPTVHTHTIANVSNLQTELDSKHKGLTIATITDISTILSSMVTTGTQIYVIDIDKYYKCIEPANPNVITAWELMSGAAFDSFELFNTATPNIQGQHRDRIYDMEILTPSSLRSIPITLKYQINLLLSSTTILIQQSLDTGVTILIKDLILVANSIIGGDLTYNANITIKCGTVVIANINLNNTVTDFQSSKYIIIPITPVIVNLSTNPITCIITAPIQGWTIGSCTLIVTAINTL